MKLAAAWFLCLAVVAHAGASPIVVTITGVTGEIRVGEGPIFGHSSYQVIPGGAPFTLTYTFDETKGQQSITSVQGDVITESKIEDAPTSSPGTNAVLQIGKEVWEFGSSTRALVTLNTSSGHQGEQFVFTTRATSNRVAAQIVPGKNSYWPKNGDWRASYFCNSLDGSTASFSADNDRVSAKGTLVPQTISVEGVEGDGQWLYAVAPSSDGERDWRLAHASPKGGYIVEEVRRSIVGRASDGAAITPSFVRYWQAWQVAAGTMAPAGAVDNFPQPATAGSSGEEKVTATARFYEGVTLPSSFASGNSRYAAGRLSSTTDPNLPLNRATLPVTASFTLHF